MYDSSVYISIYYKKGNTNSLFETIYWYYNSPFPVDNLLRKNLESYLQKYSSWNSCLARLKMIFFPCRTCLAGFFTDFRYMDLALETYTYAETDLEPLQHQWFSTLWQSNIKLSNLRLQILNLLLYIQNQKINSHN